MVDAISPLERLQAGEVADGQVRLWWCGQHSHVLRGAGATVFVDPFLTPSPSRLVPPAFRLEEVTRLDAIAVTHEHWDHFDPEFVRAALERFPDAVAVLPTPLADAFRDSTSAWARVIGAQPGTPVELPGVVLHPIPAVHGVDVSDAYDDGRALSDGLVRYLGYVIELDGVSVYHAGDTLVFDELIDALAPFHLDVALLPINGRDYYRERRNLVGNMDPREAAQLAADLRVDLLIPTHYDMFIDNLGYPGHLVDVVTRRHRGLSVAVLSTERPFTFAATPLTGGRER
ncbi:MAG TPA: MBL fold metallo-hydrolase [Baekduia sp.]|uniref:MBL fold metallo-hydrolase n=1 Tax=Baekduia sp. TaxID=2600305 RepID=UPI002D76C251|nr:MBL fold metallo-hydrolase [Baekduia sp.]HET6507972.1 MBL fold metallo-hydrolase [Baekduia sp.]